jgi:L,D-peptidoglycan transpeptidase YkuD (ErfK/YbiS/YcfS/YnhG family)
MFGAANARLPAAMLPAALAVAAVVAAPSGTIPALDSHSSHHLLVTRLNGVHNATQVVSVTSTSYRSTTATVRAFAKTRSGWRQVAGPWSAWIGQAGFAPPGHKREGDLRTPSGSFTFSFMFGVDRNPGVHYRWRHAGPDDYWDDDSASPRYNLWTDIRRHSAGRSPEPLHVTPSYADVAAIHYNAARTPGRGSAIFLHVTHHSPTTGCIALPKSQLIELLRWLRPRDHARIIMGPTATVTR